MRRDLKWLGLAVVVLLVGLTPWLVQRSVMAQTLTPFVGLTLETSGLLIYNVWVRPTAPALAEGATPEPPLAGTVSGAYMTIENTSGTDYALVGVEAGIAAMTHVHETTRTGEMMGMRMVRAVEIPAEATTLLETGGYHAMLMNLTRDIHPGEAVPLTLTFEDEGGERFEVAVAALAADFAPEPGEVAAANVQAVQHEDSGWLDITLTLVNRGTEMDSLVGVVRSTGLAERLSAVAVLAGREQDVVLLLDGFPEMRTPDELSAVTLTLEFASGVRTMIGVPVRTSEESR